MAFFSLESLTSCDHIFHLQLPTKYIKRRSNSNIYLFFSKLFQSFKLLDVLAAWCLGSMAVCRQGGGQKLCCSIARMAIREKLVAEDHACAEGGW